MLQDRLKMLVFVRPRFFPLYSGFLQFIPLYSLPFPFDTNAYLLRMPGRKSREYVRYSHLPLYFCFPYILGCCDQTMESRRRRSPMESTTMRRSPTTRSSSEVPMQEACAFSIELLLFVLAFLRQICIRVCTQILLLPLTIV